MMKRILLILVSCQILIPSVQADVKLSALFSDNALLQANKPVPVWGLADPGEPVTVRFAGQVVRSTGPLPWPPDYMSLPTSWGQAPRTEPA